MYIVSVGYWIILNLHTYAFCFIVLSREHIYWLLYKLFNTRRGKYLWKYIGHWIHNYILKSAKVIKIWCDSITVHSRMLLIVSREIIDFVFQNIRSLISSAKFWFNTYLYCTTGGDIDIFLSKCNDNVK